MFFSMQVAYWDDLKPRKMSNIKSNIKTAKKFDAYNPNVHISAHKRKNQILKKIQITVLQIVLNKTEEPF